MKFLSTQTIIYVDWQDKSESKPEPTLSDSQPIEHERRPTIIYPPENERRLTIAYPTERRSTILEHDEDLELPPKDAAVQIITTSENVNTRSRVNEQVDAQQGKVQFTLPNNFYKNVSENKEIAKLVSQLATCTNATKKV